MKIIVAMFILGFLTLNLQTAEAQTLTSRFTGQTKDGRFLTLKNAGLATWVLAEFTPCTSYPCSVKDQTTETKLSASWASSQQMADGNTVISLSNGMTVTFFNNGMLPPNPDGTRVESYWQLDIPAPSGAPEAVRLHFTPTVE